MPDKINIKCCGECRICYSGEGILASYQVGIFGAGSRSIHYVLIFGPDGEEWLGKDATSPLRALQDADDAAALDNVRLLCAGLQDEFDEVDRLRQSGFGFLRGHQSAVYMMDRPRLCAIAIDAKL